MKFELFKSDKDSKFYFNLKAPNGQIILASQGYANKAGAKNGISSVQKNCNDDNCYQRKTAANGKHHFNLLSINKKIVGKSQMYASKASMENGIKSVRTNAPKAVLADMTMA